MTEDRSTQPAESGRLAVALLSLAAAGIHFAVMADHFAEALVFGLFFAAVAWAQVLWAVAILTRPGRLVWLIGLLGNLSVIALWAMSRTDGVPIGPEPWTPEAVAAPDLLCTVLELAIVVSCAIWLVRDGRTERAGRTESRRVLEPVTALVFGVFLAVITSVAVAAAPEHEHAESGASHDHGEQAGSHAADGHGGHVMVGGSGEPDMAQVAIVRQAMRRYEDIRVARAEGWEQEHRDWPELGAHFYRSGDWDGAAPAQPGLRLRDPEYLMYSRLLTGKWKLVAVAYVFDQDRYPEPPTGLTGALYHQHIWNCKVDGDELEEEDWGVVSREECEIMGGVWAPGGVWMTHVWLVNNPVGIFAETNPRLTNITA